MKHVWLINQYAMPPKYESRLRTIKFAHYLKMKGYDVCIFASSIMHNMNINLINDNKKYIERDYDDLHFVHINTKQYHSNGISRIISSFQFHLRVIKISKHFKNPDVIVQTALVPFGNIIPKLVNRTKARYIVEVLDLWPNSFVELGMFKSSNPFVKFLFWLEYKQYQKADSLVFSMEGGSDYISDKKWFKKQGGKIDESNVHYINNGVDLEDFNKYKSLYTFKDDQLNNNSIRKIIYIGSIRYANNIGSLIDAAKYLSDLDDVVILIYGDGDCRYALERRVIEEKIKNVIFKQKWIDPKFVPFVLSKSYINILNYKSGSFGHYGGSQSKLFQYMASGHPICCNLEMMYCPISYNNIGIAKTFLSPKEYSDAIRMLVSMPKNEYHAMCQRTISVSKEYDYKLLTDKLLELF